MPGCAQFDHIAERPAEPGTSPLNILLYPNPASDRVYISFRSGKPPTGEFRMFDAAGKLVRHFEPGGKSMEIDLNVSVHPPGLYVLNYTDKRGERWSERLLIR